MTKLPLLFELADLPIFSAGGEKNFKSIQNPIWTEGKSRLIQEYIRLFTFITKHGAYIDGFAAPQRRDISEICSANLVLQTEPKWIRDFWLCDLDPKGIDLLNRISVSHHSPKRRISVIEGDFNKTINQVLDSGRIKAKTATFALLDQRTFECNWETVLRLSQFKPNLDPLATKIEIFYFLATGWLDRSIAAVQRPETAAKLERWWGKSNWRELKGMQGIPRANLLADRFKNELGYKYARAYAIHNRRRLGRTMYHMIHATDHDDASPLMLRAYRKISGRSDIDLNATQFEMEEFWNEAQMDAS